MSGNWGDPLLDFWQKKFLILIWYVSVYFPFHDVPNVFRWWKILIEGRSIHNLKSSILKPCCCKRCRMQFYYYLTQICNTFPVKDIFWMGAYSHVKAVYTFQHWWCLFRCARWQFVGTNAAPYHQRCRLLNWMLIASWLVPLFFSLKDVPSRF